MLSQISIRVVFLTAVAWAASLFVILLILHPAIRAVNVALNYQLDPSFGGYFYALVFGPAVGGALAGFFTVRLLQQQNILTSMRISPTMVGWAVALLLCAVLPIMLGILFMPPSEPQPLDAAAPSVPWTPPFLKLFTQEFLFWLIPGSLGGLLFASEMRYAGQNLSGRNLFQMALGWGFGCALGGSIGKTVVNLLTWYVPNLNDYGQRIYDLVTWMNFGIAGLIAGAIGAWVTMGVLRSAAHTPADAGLQNSNPSKTAGIETNERMGSVSLALFLIAAAAGIFVPTILFDNYGDQPMALRLLLAALFFVVIPFAIGWLTPSLWWFAVASAVLPMLFAISTIVSSLPLSPIEILARLPLFLPLLSSLCFALIGRRLRQKRVKHHEFTHLHILF